MSPRSPSCAPDSRWLIATSEASPPLLFTSIHATERLWQIANDALQVTGGTGFMREYAYERILRDARINMIFEGTNQVLRMMLAHQGLRSLQRGELAPGAARLEGVDARYGVEREELERLVPIFAARCRTALERHGDAVREAQFTLHRVADMVSALFVAAAVLSRVSASEARGSCQPTRTSTS